MLVEENKVDSVINQVSTERAKSDEAADGGMPRITKTSHVEGLAVLCRYPDKEVQLSFSAERPALMRPTEDRIVVSAERKIC